MSGSSVAQQCTPVTEFCLKQAEFTFHRRQISDAVTQACVRGSNDFTVVFRSISHVVPVGKSEKCATSNLNMIEGDENVLRRFLVNGGMIEEQFLPFCCEYISFVVFSTD